MAQLDVNQPLPNLLLLLDTSGSMTYMADGTLPNVCTPDQPSDVNRWGNVNEILTGSIVNRGCVKQDRSDPAFADEFKILGNYPYDVDYYLPYYRYTSNGCMAGPGNLPASVFVWSNKPVEYRMWNDASSICGSNQNPTQYQQAKDGLLDVYRDRVRFSLMMFDSHPSPLVGFQGMATRADEGFEGLWSYYPGWESGAASTKYGNPPDCTAQVMEVGARNFAAPPWEGRMVPFGPSQAPLSDIRFYNDRIQLHINMLRPYGATPLAGMFEDVWTYFHVDMSEHPDPQIKEPFAPAGDPLFQGGCRKSYVLLLSDGEPNLDLRPHCESGNGVCPFKEPWEYAHDLKNPPNPNQEVLTFVVGFGLSAGNGFDCTSLQMPQDLAPGGTCDGATGSLHACCTLSRIAYEGGTDQAFFADDPTSLKAALAAVLDKVAGETTSRTLPVIASGSSVQGSGAEAISYEFNTSFTPDPGSLWSGNLERRRWKCNQQNVPELQDLEDTKGDLFHANLDNNSDPPNPNPIRTFMTVVPAAFGNQGPKPTASIRPLLTQDDGLGIYQPASIPKGTLGVVANAMQSEPRAMGISSTPLPQVCSSPELGAASAGDCAYRMMTWNLGGTIGAGYAQRNHNLGAIYHATPAVVDRPAAYIRDPAYERFASLQATRPLVLYTATVDGQLHAFKVGSNDPQDLDKVNSLGNNELWSFIPPYVLPGIMSQFPSTSQILLDGRPVVKDIPFSRNLAQATAGGTASGADWRTVLVAGGYLGGGFYYALDVTDPYDPQFLWQLSSDTAGSSLFGTTSGHPAITTVAILENGAVTETAVAILPGGYDTPTGNASCSQSRLSNVYQHIQGSYTPRPKVRCWTGKAARSVTVVRLSDGKILRTFRRAANDGPNSVNPGLVTIAPIDSPIINAVPFPSDTGQVSNRAYLGDLDGTLWRLDLSNPDPLQWKIHLAFDAYSYGTDDQKVSQPIAVTPTISVDGKGDTVIVLATGDQEDFSSIDVRLRVWSLTETPKAVGTVPFTMKPNWVLGEPSSANGALLQGEKVMGPIAIFDGVAYFSTFTPPTVSGTCDIGSGRIWAVDFIEPRANTVGPLPEPRFPDGNNGFKYHPDGTDSPDLAGNPTIFGVAVTAEPSCTDTSQATDDYVGKHATLSQSSPPAFKLRFHTGAEGGQDTDANVHTGDLAVPQPRAQGYIDSWASVVE